MISSSIIAERFDEDIATDDAKSSILNKLLSGEEVRLDDPNYDVVRDVVDRTIKLSAELNRSTDTDQVRAKLEEILHTKLDESLRVMPPFYTNFGRFTTIGKNVFINHACSFLDMGGITIEDNVLIGPKVNIVTENHPEDPAKRSSLVTKPVLIKNNAWIGAGANILPGVTVGKNAIVAAGAVVTKDVPDNTVVGGVPAKFIKSITEGTKTIK